MRPVPPSIDKRNNYQRSLDEYVRRIHNELGADMEGFILIAYGDKLNEPRVYIHGTLELDGVPTYAEATTQWAIDTTLESMG